MDSIKLNYSFKKYGMVCLQARKLNPHPHKTSSRSPDGTLPTTTLNTGKLIAQARPWTPGQTEKLL